MPRYADPRPADGRRPEPAKSVRREPEPAPAAHDAAALAALARSSPASSAQLLRALQHGAGNASVQAMLRQVPDTPGPAPATETMVERYAFEAEIPRGPSPQGGAQPTVAARSDAPPGMEEAPQAALASVIGAGVAADPETAPPAGGASTAAPAAPAPDTAAKGQETGAGEGVTISLPDIEVPALAAVAKTDAVSGSFSYSGSIARGGAAPSGFGVTHSFSSKLTGITTTLAKKVYKVKATLEHPIEWEVRSGTGPDSQVDIAGETDGDITATNYPDVVKDLTPDMSDLNGRPPRDDFWAEDLTIRHEKVHAADDKKNGPGAMRVTSKWLGTQTAASVADVTTLLGEIPDRFAAALLAALSTEDGEKHAYGDGAPSYKARAKAIKKRGDAGKYP
jgi:hypothetical protein